MILQQFLISVINSLKMYVSDYTSVASEVLNQYLIIMQKIP